MLTCEKHTFHFVKINLYQLALFKEPEPEPSSSTMYTSFPSSTDLSGSVPHSISVLNPLSTILSQDPVSCPWPNMASSIHTTTTTKEKTTASSFQWAEPVYISNNANFFCKICKVNCSGSISFKQHIKGQKHKANLKKKQPTRNSNSNSRSGENACSQSHIRCHDEVEIHFNGKKRKAKCEEGKGSQKLWCQLCQVACSHEDTYWLHLKGKAHVNNLKARGL